MIQKNIQQLRKVLWVAKAQEIDVTKKISDPTSFSGQRASYVVQTYNKNMKELKEIDNPELQAVLKEIEKTKDIDEMLELISQMEEIKIKDKQVEEKAVKLPPLPYEIKDEIKADVEEMQKSYNSGCYRAATILCGRILETALHRKYFEIVGQDILETQPGIGLGKLIAKLKEKEVSLAPGLTEQIHLINQVRINSVHKKQSTFRPSQDQAKAMMLYTLDILRNMF